MAEKIESQKKLKTQLNQKQLTLCLHNFFLKHNIEYSKRERILFTLYCWFGQNQFITLRQLKKISNCPKLNPHWLRWELDVFQYIHVFDNGILLTNQTNPLIINNFIDKLMKTTDFIFIKYHFEEFVEKKFIKNPINKIIWRVKYYLMIGG